MNYKSDHQVDLDVQLAKLTFVLKMVVQTVLLIYVEQIKLLNQMEDVEIVAQDSSQMVTKELALKIMWHQLQSIVMKDRFVQLTVKIVIHVQIILVLRMLVHLAPLMCVQTTKL